MSKKTANYALGLTIALAAIYPAAGQMTPFSQLDFPGASLTAAWGINDQGQIVGLYAFSDKLNHGFLYSGGLFTSIDVPGASITEAYGINTAGDIVGDYTAGGKMHGFVLSHGQFTTVDVPGSTSTALAAIDAAGDTLAFYTIADGSAHSSLIRGDQFINIDIPGQTTTSANGINSNADIVGNETLAGSTHGFILTHGKRTLVDAPGATFTGAYGIDSAGNVVGRYRDGSNVYHGYVLSGGAFTTFDIPGATFTGAAAINNAGDIVGRFVAGGTTHGFLLTSPVLRYTLTDLGALPGGNFSQASYISDRGVIAGTAALADGTQHSTLWQFGGELDIALPGYGGVNGGAFGVNGSGLVDGQVELATMDPNGEDFCGYGTHRECRAFSWNAGVTTLLPTLGGNNSSVGTVNNSGMIAGFAESNVLDPNCRFPQSHRFEPVIWGPAAGQIRQLALLGSDTVGVALWINESGQAVGAAGTCADTTPPPFANGPRAMLWEADGTPVDMGNLGGTVNPSALGQGNIALAINNDGQAVGASPLLGNQTNHAFLWTKHNGMRDLGTLPGDVNSAAIGINDRGVIIGQSFGAAGPLDGNPSAVIWRNGVITNLNSLMPADAPLYILVASGINNDGQIVGFGATPGGDLHAFIATPQDGPSGTFAPPQPALRTMARPVLLDHAKKVLSEHLGRLGGH